MRTLAHIGFFLALAAGAFGQTPDAAPTPTFATADVHVSPHSNNPSMRGGFYRGGRYELHTATMVDLIRLAWGLDSSDKVVGGPAWLDDNRYDVIAKASDSATRDAANLMLRKLLADRFRLVVRPDTKPVDAYVLTKGKRAPLMKEASGDGTDGGCQMVGKPAGPGEIPLREMACHNMTMTALIAQLPGLAGAYFGSFPTVDLTGLEGGWDFTLRFTGRAQLQAAGSDGISLFDAVDKQLGLKLELQKVPMPVVVVEKVNDKPTSNPPGVTQKLTTAPREFEVADIKPSPADETPSENIRGSKLELRGITLKELIHYAWDIDESDSDMLVGGPKWLDTARFDVVAKAPSDDPASGPQLDFDALREMARNLLVARFKLATHNEERPVTVYALTAVKSKLRAADASNRTNCRSTPAAAGANSPLSRSLTCQNIAMSQLADKLRDMAGGYIDHPVIDATDLKGSWDLVLSFTPARLMQNGGGRGGDAGPTSAASDPNGRLTVFEALERQLGLKLETRKAPMQVLVIDHVEQEPNEN